MSDSKYYADIHSHPSMKPYYSSLEDKDKKNMWEFLPERAACNTLKENAHRFLEKKMCLAVDDMAKYSQMNFESCQKGQIRLVFSSLYPVERGWFKLRDLADWLSDDKFITQSSICSSGFHPQVIRKIEDHINKHKPINYFHDLVGEYHYLTSAQAQSNHTQQQFVLVNDYQQLRDVLNDHNQNKIALILNIEGGHSLNQFRNYHDLSNTPFRKVNKKRKPLYKYYRDIYFEHIDIIKGLSQATIKQGGEEVLVSFQHTPFYLTLAHHFWNLLCGHADSFQWSADLILEQGRGKNRGFTALGKTVLHRLLNRDAAERRILIDIKHLSIRSRIDFYQIWEEYHKEGDSFPIICSHTAVNGREGYQAFGIADEEKNHPNYQMFNSSDINMFDYDIQMVHRSKGLIGIMLSSSRLPGDESQERIKKAIKKMKRHPELKPSLNKKIKREHIRNITANVFHIIRLGVDNSAWDRISIGSDFDGMITPLLNYEKAEQYPLLADDLTAFLIECPGIEEMDMDASEMRSLMQGYQAHEIVDKLMRKNALDFARRYFHDGFLKFGEIGL